MLYVFIDELRPPDMNSFIKQVAALEGDKFDGGIIGISLST